MKKVTKIRVTCCWGTHNLGPSTPCVCPPYVKYPNTMLQPQITDSQDGSWSHPRSVGGGRESLLVFMVWFSISMGGMEIFFYDLIICGAVIWVNYGILRVLKHYFKFTISKHPYQNPSVPKFFFLGTPLNKQVKVKLGVQAPTIFFQFLEENNIDVW